MKPLVIDIEKEWDRAFEESLKVLNRKGVFIYPTDTVYGLGGDALDDYVVAKIYEIKSREKKKPLSVAVGNLGMLLKFFDIDEKMLSIMVKYFPGPYTFIIKPKMKIAGLVDKVGVRVPNHYFIRKLCIEFGKPIITTSANISGNPARAKVEEIDEEVIKKVDLVVKGRVRYGISSTVVDLIDKRIVRKGVGEFDENDFNLI